MLYALMLAAAVARPLPPTVLPTPAATIAAPPQAQPVQWEYTVVQTYGINPGATQEFMGLRSESTARYLNTLGAQGWELVGVERERDGERVYYFFKRPIPR